LFNSFAAGFLPANAEFPHVVFISENKNETPPNYTLTIVTISTNTWSTTVASGSVKVEAQRLGFVLNFHLLCEIFSARKTHNSCAMVATH